MKLIYTILLLICFKANATIYYVSEAGNDTNNGTSISTTWQTIAKVNSSTFLPGDQILFKAGDSWNERLNPPSSGSVGNVITFGAYGTGVKPIITGFQSLTLSDQGGNIWTATATNSVKNLNTVLIGNIIRAKGRYPNTGYEYFHFPATQTKIIGYGLTGTPSYVGAEAVVRSTSWILDISKISSQSVDTLNLETPLTYAPNFNTNGFFFQNHPSLLDILNEWSYDSTTKLLSVYSTSEPIVKISTIDTLVYTYLKDYLVFDGLNFTGSNKVATYLDSSFHCSIINCSFNNNGEDAIELKNAHYTIVQNDSINNSLNGGIYTKASVCNNVIVYNNYIHNTAIYAGMGLSGNSKYTGVVVIGDNATITNNKIFNSGYDGIISCGINALVKYNYIDTFCFIKDDGGGIYFEPIIPNTGSIARLNIVKNGIGASIGNGAYTNYPYPNSAVGIYLDGNTSSMTVDSNTVAECNLQSILLNNASTGIVIRDNTLINGIGTPLFFATTGNSYTVRKNILYSSSPSYPVFCVFNINSTTSDSNYLLRPISESLKMRTDYSNYMTLPAWRVNLGWDINSQETPVGITSTTGSLYINPTLSDSTIVFGGTKIDAKGVSYSGSVVIKPFQSRLLFPFSTIAIPGIQVGTRATRTKFKNVKSL